MENALNAIIKNGIYGKWSNGSICNFETEEEDKEKDIADYMAHQIISGKLTFEDCMINADREEIMKILSENGR